MKSLFVAGICSVALVGCASYSDYYKSVEVSNRANLEVQKAQAAADVERYRALAMIAQTGDATAKVAATMAIAMQQRPDAASTRAAVAQAPQNEALQWASVLVPGVTQGLSIYYGAKQNINASNNATQLGMHTNGTFAQFASEINSPTVVTQPAPVVVTQPSPVIVEQPAPVIVNPEVVKPEVVNPVIVNAP